MFNVTVIRLKDIIKYPVSIAIIMIIVYCSTRYFLNEETKKEKVSLMDNIKSSLSQHILYPIQKQLVVIPSVNDKDKTEVEASGDLIDENNDNADKEFTTYMLNTALRLQLGVINAKEIHDTNIKVTEGKVQEEKNNTKEKEEITLASQKEESKVVTENPIKETYTNKYNGIKIKNETDFKLTDSILNPKNLDIDKNKVLIFHTHTCESYTQSEGYEYKASGNFRTTDLNYSVAKVGDNLQAYLEKYDFKVTHNKTYHDYPAYSGSYNRSLTTVKNELKKNKSDIIIDLHRDAIGSNSKYAPTVKIGEDNCAQLMFVIGTNGGGLDHDNWKSNLKFAVKIQETANELYPGLFKPIILRNSRYNQHLGKAACIIEVGATGNTLDQCLNSMKYLSAVMNKALKK